MKGQFNRLQSTLRVQELLEKIMYYEESLDNVGLFNHQREVKHPNKDYIISRQPKHQVVMFNVV